MERKCIWKNFILFTVSGLLALHLNLGHAQEEDISVSSPDASDYCVLGED